MTKTVDLCAALLQRSYAITRLRTHHLALDWLKEAPIPQLMDCCDRMDRELPGVSVADKRLQAELIRNPAFAAWYARLLPLFPEEQPVEQKPEPVRNVRYYQPAPKPVLPSRRSVLTSRLGGVLEACQAHEREVTTFPQERLMDVLELDQLPDAARLVFLENFAQLSGDTRQTAINSLTRCYDVPLELTEQQKALLLEPYITTRHLFASAPFCEVAALLGDSPELLNIVRLLHDRHIHELLTLAHYRAISQNAAEHRQLLSELLNRLEPDAANAFMAHWEKNGCPLHELRTMLRRSVERPDLNWAHDLSTKSGYVNRLYGSRLKEINLAAVSPYQENILIYAIVHNKMHFIRLVDEQTELFLTLPATSMLFQEKLYREHFNLNELTVRDLEDCARITQRQLSAESLSPGRRYTFPELRELSAVPGRYKAFYHLLQSDSQDYRLKVLRQVHKREVLPPDMGEAELAALAANLDVKPLDIWMQTDFGHIHGLAHRNAARMLANLDMLRHLLPGMKGRTDALLALRCLNRLEQYDSITELKEDLLQTDADWHALSKEMCLTPEFQREHRESVIRFLCSNGAYIAEAYRRKLDSRQQEAFLRVVKAELMGQLDKLKYHEGDLQRELDSPLTARIKAGWRDNLSMSKDGLDVREHDDFFSTMLLGTQPQRTCLSYLDGAYKECLLSAFDSNKKILYATLNGRIVGRAFLRLTKGRLTGADAPAGDEVSGFTFVDLEADADARPEREKLTLFLERPYISGVGPEVKQQIIHLFAELAGRKADALDTMLVLSADYRSGGLAGFTQTRYALYISKSKAGAQYLDSLGGQATVSTEGSYRANTFLVRERERLPNASGF